MSAGGDRRLDRLRPAHRRFGRRLAIGGRPRRAQQALSALRLRAGGGGRRLLFLLGRPARRPRAWHPRRCSPLRAARSSSSAPSAPGSARRVKSPMLTLSCGLTHLRPGDLLAVDERPVGGLEIDHHHPTVAQHDLGVLLGDVALGQDDVVLVDPADEDSGLSKFSRLGCPPFSEMVIWIIVWPSAPISVEDAVEDLVAGFLVALLDVLDHAHHAVAVRGDDVGLHPDHQLALRRR